MKGKRRQREPTCSNAEELSDVADIDCKLFSSTSELTVQLYGLLDRLGTCAINVPPVYFTSRSSFDVTSKALFVLQQALNSVLHRLAEQSTRMAELQHELDHLRKDGNQPHSNRTFTCQVCGKVYPSPQSLSSHTKKRHANAPPVASSSTPPQSNDRADPNTEVLKREVSEIKRSLQEMKQEPTNPTASPQVEALTKELIRMNDAFQQSSTRLQRMEAQFESQRQLYVALQAQHSNAMELRNSRRLSRTPSDTIRDELLEVLPVDSHEAKVVSPQHSSGLQPLPFSDSIKTRAEQGVIVRVLGVAGEGSSTPPLAKAKPTGTENVIEKRVASDHQLPAQTVHTDPCLVVSQPVNHPEHVVATTSPPREFVVVKKPDPAAVDAAPIDVGNPKELSTLNPVVVSEIGEPKKAPQSEVAAVTSEAVVAASPSLPVTPPLNSHPPTSAEGDTNLSAVPQAFLSSIIALESAQQPHAVGIGEDEKPKETQGFVTLPVVSEERDATDNKETPHCDDKLTGIVESADPIVPVQVPVEPPAAPIHSEELISSSSSYYNSYADSDESFADSDSSSIDQDRITAEKALFTSSSLADRQKKSVDIFKKLFAK